MAQISCMGLSISKDDDINTIQIVKGYTPHIITANFWSRSKRLHLSSVPSPQGYSLSAHRHQEVSWIRHGVPIQDGKVGSRVKSPRRTLEDRESRPVPWRHSAATTRHGIWQNSGFRLSVERVIQVPWFMLRWTRSTRLTYRYENV